MGHAKGPPPERWLEDGRLDLLPRTGFPAVEHLTNPLRWPWSVEVTPLLVVPRLEDAPPVQGIGIAPRSMSQQSHIRLRDDHYALVADALAGIVAVSAQTRAAQSERR